MGGSEKGGAVQPGVLQPMQMKRDYREQLHRLFPLDDDNFEALLNGVSFRKVPSGTVLLPAGEVATKLHIVLNGCLRMYVIKEDGKEVTLQFFVENQMVASFESAMTGTPSRSYIDAVEDSIIGFLPIKVLQGIAGRDGSMRDGLNRFLVTRLIYYMNRCASYILDNPEKRYLKLVEESPELVARLPKQYIASYLGVTPVSLSRIRSRLKKKTGKN
jgi:CRP-like cAMP-binding protein